MSDAMLRVDELSAAVDVEDLTVEPNGTGRLTVRRSKTDQDGEGGRDVPRSQREPGHRRTVVATVLALLCVGCNVTDEQPQRRVSGQMSQAELRAQRGDARGELLAFADCLEGSDSRVQPANYPDCLSHNLTGWRMRQFGYQTTLQEIANKYEPRMQAVADAGSVATDEQLAAHYVVYALILGEMAAEIRAAAAEE